VYPSYLLDDALVTLCSFTGTNGEQPYDGLVWGNDGNLYGTTAEGGSHGDGTVFKVTPSGSLTTLVSLNGTNGFYPRSGLLSGTDGNFYGTACIGGTNGGYGTVFKMTPSGTLTTLYMFSSSNGSGENPNPGLTQQQLRHGVQNNFLRIPDGPCFVHGAKWREPD
jgi:uncharacterized repeat protein (TIGR03803 family)